MELWQKILQEGIDGAKDLVDRFGFDNELANRLNNHFHIRINTYYLSLIHYPGDPIWLQCIPDAIELEDDGMPEDPLGETSRKPVPSIIHKYPDNVQFLITNEYPVNFRFNGRRYGVSDFDSKSTIAGLEYIEARPEIRDVILTGGDPLMLSNNALRKVIDGLRSIRHVEIIRLKTSMMNALPQRITPKLCKMLRRFHPVYMIASFNHPFECTPEAEKACRLISDAGIPIGAETLLIKGVNDSPDVMLELMRKLLRMRVRPSFLLQGNITKGTNHFRTPVSVGLEIMDKLQGHTSDIAVPNYVIDTPGGGGKIPLLPQYVLGRNQNQIILRNYKYDIYTYPDVEDPSKPVAYSTQPLKERSVRKRGKERRAEKKVREVIITEVFIGIYDEDVSTIDIERTQSAVREFMSCLGFELLTVFLPEYGSFFERSWFFTKEPKTQDEANKNYENAKEVLRLNQIDESSSIATMNLSASAERILSNIKDYDRVVVRLGNILVIKFNRNEEEILFIETVSAKIAEQLSNSPTLLDNPERLYEYLLENAK